MLLINNQFSASECSVTDYASHCFASLCRTTAKYPRLYSTDAVIDQVVSRGTLRLRALAKNTAIGEAEIEG